MDPDAVVALATEILSNCYPKSLLRHSEFPKSHLEHGLNVHINERTASVLDAIATICVERPKSDVVAVALKLALPTVCFFIAANDERCGSRITNQLKTTWGILKDVSDANSQPCFNSEKVNMKLEIPSKHQIKDAEIPLVNLFYFHIYSFCKTKVIRRYEKHQSRLEILITRQQLQDPNVVRKVQRLIDITKAIRLILKGFNHLCNEDEKAKIIRCLGNILDRQYEVAEEILKSKLITLCNLTSTRWRP